MDTKPSLHFYITCSLKEAIWIHAFHKYICMKVNQLFLFSSLSFSEISVHLSVVIQNFLWSCRNVSTHFSVVSQNFHCTLRNFSSRLLVRVFSGLLEISPHLSVGSQNFYCSLRNFSSHFSMVPQEFPSLISLRSLKTVLLFTLSCLQQGVNHYCHTGYPNVRLDQGHFFFYPDQQTAT